MISRMNQSNNVTEKFFLLSAIDFYRQLDSETKITFKKTFEIAMQGEVIELYEKLLTIINCDAC